MILTDLNMPGLDGFGFLARLREGGDMPPTIVLTAFGNIETAVKTVHELGAYWFLEKPIQPDTLEVLIRRAGTHAGLRAEKRDAGTAAWSTRDRWANWWARRRRCRRFLPCCSRPDRARPAC